MKTTFKTTILAVILLVSVTASSQEKPLTFGVKGGLNLSNFGGDVEEADAKVGFNIGGTLDYMISQGFYLQSGLELTTKGAKSKEDGVSFSINAMYLQLPVHAAYKVDVAETTKISFFAGPYFAYGIGGKTSVKESGVSVSVDTFQKDLLKSFDLGIGGGVAAEFNNKIVLSLGYDFGLANISDTDGSVKNRNAYLTLGYRF